MSYGLGKKTVPGKLFDFQRSPPNSRLVHPKGRKSSKSSRRPTCMNKELLTELKHYKEAYKRRKQGQVTQRNTVLCAACRHVIRITKAHLELNLARNTKGREKGFYKYISRKRKTWENVGLLLNGEGDLLRKG